MPRDLAGELTRAFRPLLPPEGGLADAKLRGRRRRRRHRFLGATIAVTAAALIGGLAAGPFAPGAQGTHVVVGATGPPGSNAPPSGAATAEPTTFVADLLTGGVAVIGSRSGSVVRQLVPTKALGTPVTLLSGHDTFGTLSADGRILYLDAPEAKYVSGCSPAGCGIRVATGKITSLPAFDWGKVVSEPLRHRDQPEWPRRGFHKLP